MQLKTFTAAACLLGAASAHFFITYPDPIPGSNPKDPLAASGSDFPCHGADVTQGSVTNLQAGQVVPLEFGLGAGANTAVHGGGSCQISLTYKTAAADLKNPSNWYVIQSFIGGCPTDYTDNLQSAVMCPTSYPDCVNNINFTVPNEVANGNAILAWTWFNNIGNREMYMNCAKVSVSGGQNQLSDLPAMMAANIGNGCSTTESTNVDFPNPGKYVVKEQTFNFPTKLAVGAACGTGSGSASVSPMAYIGGPGQVAAANLPAPDTVGGANPPDGGAAAGAGGGAASPATTANSGGASTTVTPAATTASATAGAGSGSGSSASGGVFAPGASSAAAATTLATSTSTSAAAAASTGTSGSGSGSSGSGSSGSGSSGSGTGSSGSGSSSSGSGSCASGAVACSADGFYCIDANTFGECAYGCAIPMAVAAGTQCKDGAIAFAADYPARMARRGRLRRRL